MTSPSSEAMDLIAGLVFYIDFAALLILLFGVCWSVIFPVSRIWPPPSKRSWQNKITWLLFYLVFGLNTILIIADWNTWIFKNPIRLILGTPLILVGAGLFIWGIRILGIANTSGNAYGFLTHGPYRFTRNPQYLGDIFLFIGLSICANSLYLWITHTLLIMVFLIAPIVEEDWLKEQYGDEYKTYLSKTSRFL